MIENFFGLLKSELLYLQEFQTMEHVKQELLESGLLQQPQDQGKTEGLAACYSQTTSPFDSLNNSRLIYLSNFLVALHFHILLFRFFCSKYARNPAAA